MSQNKIKNLVLTGASRGIGHATVKRFSLTRFLINLFDLVLLILVKGKLHEFIN